MINGDLCYELLLEKTKQKLAALPTVVNWQSHRSIIIGAQTSCGTIF